MWRGIILGKLYIVRHAMVNVDAQVPASQWRLSADGIKATRELALRETWGDVNTVYHSPEPKAVETAKVIAEVIGASLQVEPDLRELAMNTGFLTTEEFDLRVGAYLDGAFDDAFEDYSEAQERIVTCVNRLVRDAQGQSIALVSHGRILTVFFSAILNRRLGYDEWKSIGLPDLSVVDTETWKVERGFFTSIR
jgi:2,3-bisphosphoglycerate-dependent phosphoglycerate mutase